MRTLAAFIFLFAILPRAAATDTPNIIIVLADDLGWGDPQCYQADSKIPTPAMDRLAAEGILFTDAHSPSAVCTPTRYGLLTGRYAWRTRLESGVLDGYDPPLIGAEEDTLATLLKRAGYETHCIGKWHLGFTWTDLDGNHVPDRERVHGFRPGYEVDYSKPVVGGPIDVGFDSWFGISASLDMSPYCYMRDDRVIETPRVKYPETKDGMFMNQVPGVTTDDFRMEDVLPRIASETVAIIRDSQNDPTPFFCYVPLTSPHLPVVPDDSVKGTSHAGSYGDFVVATDRALEAILQALDETGQSDDTLVVFTSDNGGLFHSWDFRADDDGGAAPVTRRGEETARFDHYSNAHWRGTKADIFEGGHRVPFLVRWPQAIAKKQASDATVELTDLYATISELVGEPAQGDSGMDSVSLLPIFKGEESSVRNFSVHHSLRGMFALRRDQWKLIEGRGSGGFTRPRELEEIDPPGQLYHLGQDPQERNNLYVSHPDKAAELSHLLAEVKASGGAWVNAQLPMPAEITAAQATLPEGFAIDVIAAEPDLRQPIAFNWDHHGRLYVAECLTYAERTLNFDLTESDRIVVFSDQDKDGSFETRTVFADDLKRLTSVAVGFGGVWALTPPALLFIPDADGDLVPDGPPQVVLDGFDAETGRHNIANGLKWGPDGWLYGRHGILGTSFLGEPGTRNDERLLMNTGVWRFHPSTGKIEAWTHGGTNTWGHDWNEDGELFYINTVIGHFWHGIPGAFTRRMFGEHDRPYLYELVEMHADHWHFDINGDWKLTRENVDAEDAFGGGHAHAGLMIYQADKWPAVYRDNVFALNFHGRRINRETLHREGSGYVARHAPDFVQFPDRWFRGIDIIQGPDGDAYVMDWSDTGECHDHDGVHRGSGRIYRIRYGDPGSGPDTLPQSIDDLESWIQNENVWYARQAILMIHELRGSSLLPEIWIDRLRSAFQAQTKTELAVRYFQALRATGALDSETLLDHPIESIRVQAVYALRDAPSISSQALKSIEDLARRASPRVRLAIASLLPRLDSVRQAAIAANLLSHESDADDANYLPVLWQSIERFVGQADRSTLEALLDTCALDGLRSLVFRRLAEDYEANRSLVSDLLLRQPNKIAPGLSGIAKALEGLPRASPLLQWGRIEELATGHPDLLALGSIFGNGRSLEQLFQMANDATLSVDARRQAIRSLVNSDYPDLKAHLMSWIDENALVGVAATGLARFDDDAVGQRIIERFAMMTAEERAKAVETIVTRPNWTRLLLERIKDNRLTQTIISAAQARQIARFDDPELARLLGDVWGEVNSTEESAATRALAGTIRALPQSATFAEADLAAGQTLFQQLCASCHRLYGEGSDIGPDLTGSQRSEVEYLIENILYPSAIVPSAYRLATVTLKDGRALAGVIEAQSNRRISLRSIGSESAQSIPKSEIHSIDIADQSLMPAGLLNSLDEQQLIDIIAYLMSNGKL